MVTIEMGYAGLWYEGDWGNVWITTTKQGEDHVYPHPDLKRWGVVREEGEFDIYLGPIFIGICPGRTKRALQERNREQFQKEWMERHGEPFPVLH